MREGQSDHFNDKGLKVVQSDKGGNLCVVNTIDYNEAVSKHLSSSPIYRRVSMLRIEKLEDKINEVWHRVCNNNKIPSHIRNMYTSKCTKFASIHAVVKTHKSSVGNLVIRPIINGIDSPGYNLTRFLQKIIQPIVCNEVLSSEIILNKIKNMSNQVLSENNYPFSLDVVEMFHNIPRDKTLDILLMKLAQTPNLSVNIPPLEIIQLITVCLNTNHFRYENQLYVQRSGLPMGNRLSGVLSEVFIQTFQSELLIRFTTPPPIFRYVDDIIIFTSGEDEAKRIFQMFNDTCYNMKFTLELPVNNSLPYLDFKVTISPEGNTNLEFYRKPMRGDNFINGETALPERMIHNIILNEKERISKRCTDREILNFHKDEFKRRLLKNGHNPEALSHIPEFVSNRRATNPSSPKFFLTVPFINNTFEYKLRGSLRELGLKIHIAHKSNKLKHAISVNRAYDKCNLPKCRMKNKFC